MTAHLIPSIPHIILCSLDLKQNQTPGSTNIFNCSYRTDSSQNRIIQFLVKSKSQQEHIQARAASLHTTSYTTDFIAQLLSDTT